MLTFNSQDKSASPNILNLHRSPQRPHKHLIPNLAHNADSRETNKSPVYLPQIAPNLDKLISNCQGIQASVKDDKAHLKRSVTNKELREKKSKAQLVHNNLNYFKHHHQYQLGKKKLEKQKKEAANNQYSEETLSAALSPHRGTEKLLSFEQFRSANAMQLLKRNKRRFGQGLGQKLSLAPNGSPSDFTKEQSLERFSLSPELSKIIETKHSKRNKPILKSKHYRSPNNKEDWNTSAKRKRQFKALTIKSKLSIIFSKCK